MLVMNKIKVEKEPKISVDKVALFEDPETKNPTTVVANKIFAKSAKNLETESI